MASPQPPFLNQPSDRCAGNEGVIYLDRTDKVDDKAEFVSHFPQKIHVALSVVTEGVVISHHDLLDSDFLNQDFVDEIPGRDGGKLSVKGHAHDDIDPRLFDEFKLLAGMSDQVGTIGRSHDLQGVGFKGHDHGLSADGFCSFLDLVKKSEVSFVDSVKVADRQNRMAERLFDFVEVEDHTHESERLPFPTEPRPGKAGIRSRVPRPRTLRVKDKGVDMSNLLV